MKVQALYLGDLYTDTPFLLYRFPVPLTPPVTSSSGIYYYCLEDLEQLGIISRHVNLMTLYQKHPTGFFKKQDGRHYTSTQVLIELGHLMKSKILLDLCQITEHLCQEDLQLILQPLPVLTTTLLLVEHEFTPVRLDGQEWFLKPCYPSVPLRTNPSSLLLQRRLAPKLGHHAPHLSIHTYHQSVKRRHMRKLPSFGQRKQVSLQSLAHDTSHQRWMTGYVEQLHRCMDRLMVVEHKIKLQEWRTLMHRLDKLEKKVLSSR
ncbi:uncharacterized protein BX664DRAFT_111787 [Halteromyces radiatus]|uniref:uncharacterized protein n=1 Tax=Halteromyces radiatus TaxID=101107 RepID=UPI00221FBA4D|nr:uncharacterized protein BX664DRAFT_111787 [Halteromyces radiatus]KAI8093647.1 hypothetical protein BX664DRAFT_111787 [Halteromyces radiatus]